MMESFISKLGLINVAPSLNKMKMEILHFTMSYLSLNTTQVCV